ncbi:hypothetical protein DBIPINDM_007622 (plasmid) [Mesorhizobium sp. AR02]|uniref:hypothetical protein n=1 Tax=Mesorhizobium sp. AR02 TaxID=2865837 RepID=UPI002160733D|nr:hypothetical protein [Mesorhizobium sp. AR02]UVK49630.1 hypothetical protein DBIPINDM_007622 [Mesorhizobium sp. AR02]
MSTIQELIGPIAEWANRADQQLRKSAYAALTRLVIGEYGLFFLRLKVLSKAGCRPGRNHCGYHFDILSVVHDVLADDTKQ